MTTVEEAAAVELAEHLLDGSRRHPVLGISLDHAADTTRIDLGALSALLAGGEVRVLVGPEATWTLKRSLPPGLDVYGCAVRLWWPSPGGLALREHPLGLLDPHLEVDGSPLVAWLEAQLTRGPRVVEPPVSIGLEQQAVVLEVGPDRAIVRLADGGTAELPAGAFSGTATTVDHLLRVAQTLRVRVPPSSPGQRRKVTPVWSADDVRRHLEAQCPAGSTILGRVSSLRSHGATVSLLPGVVGALDVGEVARTWVRHVEDHLTVGDVIAVRLLDHRAPHPGLSMLETSPEPLAPSYLPDGPPWLSVGDQLVGWDEPPLATELPSGRSFGDEPEAAAGSGDPGGPDEVLLLLDAVHRGRVMHDELVRTTEIQERHLAGLRAEARQLLRDLERDLAQARERIVTTTGSARDLVGNAEEALGTARNEVARLRRELHARTEEQAEATARAQAAEARAERAEELAAQYRHRADLHSRTAASLRAELARFAPESRRLVEAIRASWIRNTTRDDREAFPWREPVVGPGFLMSLHRVEGVSLERVYDVCAEVACGRAEQRHGLAVHALRATDASGSPQQTRDDGALAFRASLQSRTAAARRLHYWKLADGRVELAKIGYHDDFTI